MSGLRERLLSAQSKSSEILEFPDLPDEQGKPLRVKVRGMSYAERTTLIKDCAISEDRLDMVKMMPRAIIATFVDPLTDKPVFSAPDADTIGQLPPEIIERARDVIWRVIGLAASVTEKNSATEAVASAPASTSPNV